MPVSYSDWGTIVICDNFSSDMNQSGVKRLRPIGPAYPYSPPPPPPATHTFFLYCNACPKPGDLLEICMFGKTICILSTIFLVWYCFFSIRALSIPTVRYFIFVFLLDF